MKAFATSTILALLPCLISALPSAVSPSPEIFVLQTVAVDGTKYDGLYVVPTHTYAGGNVPGLYKSKADTVPSFLDEGALFFHFPHSSGGNYPFGLSYTDYAAAWIECTIDVGAKELKHEFKVNKDGYLITAEKRKSTQKNIQENINKEFQGAYWRVCKWTHGYPELFLNNPETSNNPDPTYVPENCSLVNLKVVYL